jgi:(2Fe-2S) ferredoxin
MEKNEKEPTLMIKCPDGSQIIIYQELSESYIKELVDEFTKREGVVVTKSGQ